MEVAVDVTFLRMASAPAEAGPALPPAARVVRLNHCSAQFYRYLYDTVGAPWLWWMRRTVELGELQHAIAPPRVSIHVLYVGGEPVGFYELERRLPESMNLSYFGLVPWAIGKGVGKPFLRHAIDAAWAEAPRQMTVNTCTADHPRALPNYIAAGFTPLRTLREIWPVPLRLGLKVPEHLCS
ncbi:GNAT family N-acetyltransferase [Roseomonas hellenica]|uniref:GNAT family N-acetyltransferase n=2 Tax=Plastoroseomonas hellenica TaxID=2687306 RepID=A0ABS5F1F4_9PROT|nr:GNAT family N-acetyltransferase [Plastoroseomonas hellenica]